MVLLVLLGILYLLVLPVLVIVALIRIATLNRELQELRQTSRALLQRLPAGTAPPPSHVAPGEARGLAPTVTPPSGQMPVSPPVAPSEAKGRAAAGATSVVLQDAPLRSARQDEMPPPNRPITLEQLLGGRALAWTGALAVTLAGIFLFKYSIDQGWLGPLARVLLAALLGVVSLAAGEALRRRDWRIAQAVSAAGVAVLYAALFAAVSLYALMPRSLGIGLAALLSGLSIALSLRQGPFVALLALIGGGLAPAIISKDSHDTLGLFSYLLALVGGVTILARWRGWLWLGWCALAAATLWAAAWLGPGYEAAGIPWLGGFLLAIAALFLWRMHRMPQDAAALWLAWVALLSMAVLASFLAGRAHSDVMAWAVFVILAGSILFHARGFADDRQLLAAVAPILSLLVFWYWGRSLLPLTDANRFALTALIVGGLLSLGAYASLWLARRPAPLALIAAGSALLHFAIVCGLLFSVDFGLSWAAISLLLAAALALTALPVAWMRQRAGMDLALTALVAGAIAFVSAAVPLAWHREWVTMGYALELPVVAWLMARLRLPLLRYLVWALVATVTIRLVFNPYVLDYDVSANPFLNWVLYGYATAIASYALTVWLLPPSLADAAAGGAAGDLLSTAMLLRVIEASMLGFAFLLLTLEVRSFFHPEGLGHSIANMQDTELYAYSIVWLLFGAALLVAGILRRSTMLRYASLIVLVLVVGKVFLIDMAGLTGLLRVASFLGLGIGLLALGFVYRRYVFRDDPPSAAVGAAGG